MVAKLCNTTDTPNPDRIEAYSTLADALRADPDISLALLHAQWCEVEEEDRP